MVVLEQATEAVVSERVPDAQAARVAQALADLDAWLETMRVTDGVGRSGYGGPVVHWWQSCLSYTGPGLDWRYDGIIRGYLTLWERTGQRRWLAKARRAGDDLVAGQLPSGNFRASCFEFNPYSGGTPHEAAASLGLLDLARGLRAESGGDWRTYAGAAETNLRRYALARLWDQEARSFRDAPDVPSLVPNKVCAMAEALFALAEVRNDEQLIERYALPALDAVLALQIHRPRHLAGAIPQDVLRGRVRHKYFPYYIARCIPAFLLAHEHTGHRHYLDGAVEAVCFIRRHLDEDGLLPQVVYPRGVNRRPQWIAPLGDVLRAGTLLRPYGFEIDLRAAQAALLEGQLPSGAIATARGFGAQVSQNTGPAPLPDFRDCIPVVGWCAMAFRHLAGQVPVGRPLPVSAVGHDHTPCLIRRSRATWTETQTEMNLAVDGRVVYRWQKGEPWADVVEPEVMWK